MKGEKEAPAPDEGDEKPSEAAEEASGKEGEGAEEVPAGIPEFWLNVLRNYEEIGNRVSNLRFAGSRSIKCSMDATRPIRRTFARLPTLL